MKDEVIISNELINEFREKYKLSNIEMAGIFDESIKSFKQIDGKTVITNLKNPQYVYELITNREKLKERVELLYSKNKSARKLYNKIFGEDDDIITKPCMREDFIAFKKKMSISKNNLAIIFGVKPTDIELFENGERYYFASKQIDLNKYIEDEMEFYKLVLKRFEERAITKKTFTTICNSIDREKGIEKKKKKYVIRTTRKTIIHEGENKEEVEKKRDNNIMEDFFKEKNPKNKDERNVNQIEKRNIIKLKKKLGDLRNRAKREEKIEFDGGRICCIVRKEFIKVLYDLLEAGEKPSNEDIEIVKNALLYSEGAVSTESIKICVIGTFKTKGYNETIKLINILINDLEKTKYSEILQEFKNYMQLEYQKLIEIQDERI